MHTTGGGRVVGALARLTTGAGGYTQTPVHRPAPSQPGKTNRPPDRVRGTGSGQHAVDWVPWLGKQRQGPSQPGTDPAKDALKKAQ